MCVSPITVYSYDARTKSRRSYHVPCGKCYECLKKKQHDSMIRMMFELRECSCASWLTLTYRPDALPLAAHPDTGECRGTLCKRDVQLWLKRLRKSLARDGFKSVRYSLCGEYGSKGTLRPHYHILFYNVPPEVLSKACSDWYKRFGSYNLKRVKISDNDICALGKYLAKYANKGVFGGVIREDEFGDKVGHPVFNDGFDRVLTKPFVVHSNYLGVVHLKKNLRSFLCLDREFSSFKEWYSYVSYYEFKIELGGFNYSLPRLWRSLLLPFRKKLSKRFDTLFPEFKSSFSQVLQKFSLRSQNFSDEIGDLFATALDYFHDRCNIGLCMPEVGFHFEESFDDSVLPDDFYKIFGKALQLNYVNRRQSSLSFKKSLKGFYAKSKV